MAKGLQHTDRASVGAHNYPTADRIYCDFAGLEEFVGFTSTLAQVKPAFLSNFSFRGVRYLCSGTFIVPDTNKPYLAVLARDTPQDGERAFYRTRGRHYLPVHGAVTTTRIGSQEWVGKTAYMVAVGNDWGVTDALASGQQGFAVGRFVEQYHFRPNGIMWGDRFVMVELDPSLAAMNSPITISDNVGDMCCFGACQVTLYPEVEKQNRRLVTINPNAFSINPLYDIDRIEWCYTGQTETFVLSNGQSHTQAKTDRTTKNEPISIAFDTLGTHTITIRVFLAKDDSSCDCNHAEPCCITRELTIDLVPNPASICLSTTGGSATVLRNDYQLVYKYTDNTVAPSLPPEMITGITTGVSAVIFPTPIPMPDTVAAKAVIEATLTSQGIVFGSVIVNYLPAAGNDAILTITVTNVNGTLVSVQMEEKDALGNVTPITRDFVLIGQ